MMRWYDEGWSTGYPGAMIVMMLALLGLAIWAGLRLVGKPPSAPSTAQPTPRAVLDLRLASGEIDAEQYATLRRLLDDRGVAVGDASVVQR
jgi:uncharacterized membrane protein